ncbi:protocadherin gamma-B6 isoform X1 [Octopus bimaculoides]|uniref:protocadherin gamma-B6 isoform X1 n=1 Tax=Octopus bimaculoides TaxID=37653 RepID=UPI00071E095F|nr:protocadherin gamma-B6 isoform X1 [Octopus bimaculoides]XP_014767715.1 protocadherin gamma-B6 isoform X1 [Octopus bimaculoides]|eukprot:XP_014767714.1 PREDICTED: protocadherin gamma-B6-like isoform X1 [Octopus bimaculoides]
MLLSIYIFLILLHCCQCVDLIYHVQEEKGANTFVGDIASDSQLFASFSSQDYGHITFTQLKRRQSSSSLLFNVTKSGKLYTAQRLDADSLCTYNKECSKIVKVAVRQAETFIKVLKIKVIIEDINDHQPVFSDKQIDLQFYETDGKGTKKSAPSAIDGDMGALNSKINYRLKNNVNQTFSLFVSKRVDGVSTLEIILEKKLDREIKDLYLVQVVAQDGGSPPHQCILNVQISVIDENDNRPVFFQNMYNVSVKNTHSRMRPVVILSAKDKDSGENSHVSYYFSPKTSAIARDHFRINKETGEIFLDKTSKLSEKMNFKLFIEARDGGSPPLSSIATVIVSVLNQENNAPTIDVDFVSVLTENTTKIVESTKVGSFIAYVMVTDNDVGHNGEVTCDLKHEKFKLSAISSKEYKVILKERVDREIEDHYIITIKCQDHGFPPLQRERKFSLQLIDVNDVQPMFTKDTFKFLTYENEKPSFPVGFVNATDPDLGLGGKLSYALFDKNQFDIPFKITDNGFISTRKSLDREQNSIYKFQVLVRDNGSPSLNNTANVIVEIMDENDNAPYFTFPSVSPFSLDLHYHPQSDTEITVLRASDRDSHVNAFLTYELIGGNDKRLFMINAHSGILSFSRAVYQNDAGSYELQFIVKDSGNPVLSATAILSLTLTVSNKTSTMLTAVQIQSSDMIDVNLVIIIVVVAVVLSIAIVIFITTCIVKYNYPRNANHGTDVNTSYQSRSEMRNLIYQTNNRVSMTRGQNEGMSPNTPSMRSRGQFYPEIESQKPSTMIRTLSKSSQMYSQPVTVTSGGEPMEQNIVMVPNYLSDTMSTKRDSGHNWNEGETKQYEEIPGLYNFRHISSTSKMD